MVVGITGHTRGIGQALFTHFESSGHQVLGWSRTSGHDISDPHQRDMIISSASVCDVFINNAYDDGSNSQLLLLIQMWAKWQNSDRVIINIGSRIGDHQYDHPNPYREHKVAQDDFCRSRVGLPRICNIRPGRVDTARVAHLGGRKLVVESVVETVAWVLENKDRFWTNSVTLHAATT